MPNTPVLSYLDPDVFAILVRNFLENTLRHGVEGAAVTISLSADGILQVENDGPAVMPQVLQCLTTRFARSGPHAGSGLGLAIVAAIAERTGSALQITSPRENNRDGFQVRFHVPMQDG